MEACFPTTIAPQPWQPPTTFTCNAGSHRDAPPPSRNLLRELFRNTTASHSIPSLLLHLSRSHHERFINCTAR
ncbi:hypothetical protein DEO72_LG8g1758 [Vigna unguiculata]|uniref:Uncharacterized protein n=1 Tax=Vigna unguiculata TaxID=3917 RepID=A0A4D6MQP5_VIGUN|nr:hypothetical protein DEO72_LG8g1758 [Vigna unguiculata]